MKLQNLQEIFNEKIFRIPDYQRGYSWSKPHLNDLWRDIKILDDNGSHYMGVLSVVKKQKESQRDAITHIIDGQQRITTLVILIQSILNSEKIQAQDWICKKGKGRYIEKYLYYRGGAQGEIKEPVFGYEEDNPSHVHFRKEVLGLETTENAPSPTFYTKRLDEAQKFFDDKLEKLSFEEIEKLLYKVTNCLKFNFYEIDNELNEFVAFETMNNRGKPLSDLELLKNRLIYLSTLLRKNSKDEKEHLRDDINNAWKTIYEYLGKKPEKELDDNDFLHTHWLMKFKYDRNKSKVYKDDLLNQYFTVEGVQNETVGYEDIKDYTISLQKVAQHYFYVHNPDFSGCPYAQEIKKYLNKLKQLRFRAFKPLIISALNEGNDEEKIIILLKRSEQFNFVAFNIQFRNSNYKNNLIYEMAHKHHVEKADFLEELQKLPDIFNFSRQEFKKRVRQDYDEKLFYDWKGSQYFLYEYELHLQEKHKSGDKLDCGVKPETEHIYPQNPNKDEWKNFDDHKHLLHDLGNLLLLSKPKNGIVGNEEFQVKKEKYKSSSYSAIEVAEKDDWTPGTVKERTEQLLDFLVKRWELNEDNNE